MPRYKIESTGNGLYYTITRLADGKTLFLQGDDANAFGDLIEGMAVGSPNEDNVCDEYSEQFA